MLETRHNPQFCGVTTDQMTNTSKPASSFFTEGADKIHRGD